MNKFCGEPRDYWKRPIDNTQQMNHESVRVKSEKEPEKKREEPAHRHISYMKGERMGFW